MSCIHVLRVLDVAGGVLLMAVAAMRNRRMNPRRAANVPRRAPLTRPGLAITFSTTIPPMIIHSSGCLTVAGWRRTNTATNRRTQADIASAISTSPMMPPGLELDGNWMDGGRLGDSSTCSTSSKQGPGTTWPFAGGPDRRAAPGQVRRRRRSKRFSRQADWNETGVDPT